MRDTKQGMCLLSAEHFTLCTSLRLQFLVRINNGAIIAKYHLVNVDIIYVDI